MILRGFDFFAQCLRHGGSVGMNRLSLISLTFVTGLAAMGCSLPGRLGSVVKNSNLPGPTPQAAQTASPTAPSSSPTVSTPIKAAGAPSVKVEQGEIFSRRVPVVPATFECSDAEGWKDHIKDAAFSLSDAQNSAWDGWGESNSQAKTELGRYKSTLADVDSAAQTLSNCGHSGWKTKNTQEKITELKSDLPELEKNLTSSNAQNFGRDFSNQMQNRVAEERQKKCKRAASKVFFAYEQPVDDTVRFHFCDGWQVVKRSDGEYMGLQPRLNSHPKWNSMMGRESVKLEKARTHASRFPTSPSAQRQKAAAEKRFSKKMRSFAKKYKNSDARYIKAAKSSKVKIHSPE